MIYFVLVISVLGQIVRNGALLELTGEAAGVEFGGALTLIHNSTEDKLVCSGKIQASDVVIEGTLTTVADLISKVSTLEEQMMQVLGTVRPTLTVTATVCTWTIIETSASYPAANMPFRPSLAGMDPYCHLHNLVQHNCTQDTAGLYYYSNPWEGGGGNGIASCHGGYIIPGETYGKPADRKLACTCHAMLTSPPAPPPQLPA